MCRHLTTKYLSGFFTGDASEIKASVAFTLKPLEQLTFPNKKGEQQLDDGYFTLMVGNLKTRFELQRPDHK